MMPPGGANTLTLQVEARMRPRLSRAGKGLKEDEQPRRNITGVVKWDGGGGKERNASWVEAEFTQAP